ncbi:unnamed protein product [Sphenostylis stenocarpa]|uniref:Uncharacterized protein n=1 Tax=Sphenostylis stenocarpa TaxID=92480 RepID=A0AA86VGL6_9FABA|nr:unnamed protein product [Sphenostylis stenocarpa]
MRQEMVDSKKMKLDRSNNTMVELPQFSMTTNLKCADLKICDGAQGLVKLCCTDISRSEHVLECESMCDGHAPIFSLQKQVSLLLSGCQELMSSASEIHIKCHYYFLIDGCSGPKEFSITLKETRQLNITRPGMEILDSSIGNLSNLKDSDVDGQQLKDLPNDLLCLRSTYYLKLSKNKGQSTGKTKIHILCDGLRYYQRISFRMLYNSLLFVPSNLSVVPWCRELTMEEWRAMLLLEARPFVPKMALRVLHPKASLMIVNRYEYVVCEIGSYLTIRDGKKVCASRYPRIKFTIGYKTDISNGYLVLTGAGVLTINLFMGRIRVSRYSC